MKKIFDYTLALISLIVLAPLFLLIAILIKKDSKGPVFFKQKRVGLNQKIFEIYKFRTMVDGAINIGKGLKIEKNDTRITKLGKFLRKTSLDELPQFINILRGEMSFVGPRPPVPYHPYKIGEYSREKAKRFGVKPGITGLAQVTGRNNLSWDERIVYDVEYVKKQSFLFDIKILINTFLKVLKKEDVYNF